MPDAAYYRRRAEKLRFALITTRDRAAVARLRTFIERYRVLAEHADKETESPELGMSEPDIARAESFNDW
jgi:hypothetical protein